MRRLNRLIIALAAAVFTAGGCANDTPKVPPQASDHQADVKLARTDAVGIKSVGTIEPAVQVFGPMPTGVAVSKRGRIFTNFPRWGDRVEFTVAELKEGQAVAYPDARINKLDPDSDDQADTLVSVQSVVIDPKDRLWILDTGSINMQPVKPGGPKLLCVDLNRNQVIKRITFPDTVALPTTYLNDVRFDLGRGKEGLAFITDSSDQGPNGIIVVDLASGTSWRKLNDHPSTKADANFTPTVEGEPLMARAPGKPEAYLKIGSDGIAIDPQRGVLYYCPLASRRLHSVSLDALANAEMPDDQVARTIKDLPQRDFASDGLECAADGTLYLTDYEHNAVRRLRNGRYEIVAADPRMIWPDSMSLSDEGQLYFTANQLNRQPKFHNGKDLREQPYVIFRTRVGATPTAAR